MRGEALLAEIARRLAAARARAGLSMAEVSRRAGVSTRYLRMAEAGEANLSILKLAGLARALRVPLRELCDLDVERDAPELRVALVGLRGAGKSSAGRRLAERLEVPFTELDERIEALAGMPLAQVFELHGEEHYRALQREALEAWLAQHGSGVLATGGSLVEDETAFERLRTTCRTAWLRAEPDEHWQRVVDQGDLRPMRNHPRARQELAELLAAREGRYALADVTVVTSGKTPDAVADELAAWVLGP